MARPVADVTVRLTSARIAFGRYSDVSDLATNPAPRHAGRSKDVAAKPVPEPGTHTNAT
ncbi:hypothetical protein KX928_15930 [Roseobacter sp. YSTF-M11]|uniref:Uncharacterized protein n=1 Tax=Roseobacter insulae TaxID=2859783 RepID=A0A9X1FX18_9RHOB|nr:hypothetical protein [Roseobacter insulae]MBW4709281.1 hypothetical protein [Roseobacter insulae]